MRRVCFVSLLLFALWQEPATRREEPAPSPVFNSPTPSPAPTWLSVPPPAWALRERSAAWWYQPPCPVIQKTREWTPEEWLEIGSWETVRTASEPGLQAYAECVWFRAGQAIPPLVYDFYGQPELRRVTAAGDTLLCWRSCSYQDTYFEIGMRPVTGARALPSRNPTPTPRLNWAIKLPTWQRVKTGDGN